MPLIANRSHIWSGVEKLVPDSWYIWHSSFPWLSAARSINLQSDKWQHGAACVTHEPRGIGQETQAAMLTSLWSSYSTALVTNAMLGTWSTEETNKPKLRLAQIPWMGPSHLFSTFVSRQGLRERSIVCISSLATFPRFRQMAAGKSDEYNLSGRNWLKHFLSRLKTFLWTYKRWL